MPFTMIARNTGVYYLARLITKIGLHTANPGIGVDPNPGEISGSGYQRSLVGWIGPAQGLMANFNSAVFAVPVCTLRYLSFWYEPPTYAGLTYYGSIPGPPIYLGFAPIVAGLFGVGVVDTAGTISAPAHGLVNGQQVIVESIFTAPFPYGYTVGPTYLVINTTPNTFQLAANQVETITITGAPTGGTYILHFDGHDTTPIALDAPHVDVAAALAALPNIGPFNVTVTGGPGPAVPYAVTFAESLAGVAVATMTATGSLTGGTAPSVDVAVATVGGTVILQPAAASLFWRQVLPLVFGTFSGFSLGPSTILLEADGF